MAGSIRGRRGLTILSASSTDSSHLQSLTVKELKEQLKLKGLPVGGLKAELVARLSSTLGDGHGGSDDDGGHTTRAKTNKPRAAKEKFVINPNWRKEFNATALEMEFNKMAKKEGFDESSAYFADDSTFEDDFNDEDFAFDDLDDDDDIPDFGSQPGLSMDERIAAAKSDQAKGRVSVPKSLDTFSEEVSFDELKKLGFRREANPFGSDETPRRAKFQILTGSMTCPACGSDFQDTDEMKPGYLPPDKFETQVKLKQIEDIQRQQEKDDSDEWSPEDEVDWLLRQSGVEGQDDSSSIDIDALADEMGLDLEELAKKKVICKRCHGLQNFGTVEKNLRPGWTDEPTLSQEQFRKLLMPLQNKVAVIIALVDLFDFSGSVLPELDKIAGHNPVILAANKADLLPSEMGHVRAENWVRRELEYLDVNSIANIGGAVRLVSCKTGYGISALMEKAQSLAEEKECDIYVVGAANAGKSTLVNYLLDEDGASKKNGKMRAGNANKWKGSVTTSPLPGTTLQFIKVNLSGGKVLYDTPGLLVPGCLTERLTPEELKIVVPKKRVEPVTFRIQAGKCALVGGLARVELIGDCKPFLFTFFVANEIKLHLTSSLKADDFISSHVGKLLTPPLEPGQARLEEIGEFEYHEIEVQGEGWKQAAADITLRGLGWVAVTGAGRAKVRIGVPKGIGVSLRPPLMPFDVWETTAKYTGGRSVRKSGKSRTGKRRKGVGRN